MCTSTQAGPGLPAVAPSPADLSPTWLCTPKSWQGSEQQLQWLSPIRPVGLLVLGSTVVQGTGKGPWGECAGCFVSLPQDYQQLEMWGARLWGPLALLLPLLLGWEAEAAWLQGSRWEGAAAVGQVKPPAP